MCAIKSPGFGDRRRGYLEDISVLTGATFVTEQLGLSLETMTEAMLGKAQRISVSKERTTMIATGDHTEEVAERIKVCAAAHGCKRATHGCKRGRAPRPQMWACMWKWTAPVTPVTLLRLLRWPGMYHVGAGKRRRPAPCATHCARAYPPSLTVRVRTCATWLQVIRAEMEGTDSEFDREKCQERIAKLGGAIGRIKVGAATETELKDKKLRYEDALNSVKAAMDEGVVPGGGSTLVYMLRTREKILAAMSGEKEDEDEKLAVDLLFRAIQTPVMQIAENAGTEGAVVLERVKDQEFGFGWNAATGVYENLLESGVIDPATVTMQAVLNSASIAASVITVCSTPTATPFLDPAACLNAYERARVLVSLMRTDLRAHHRSEGEGPDGGHGYGRRRRRRVHVESVGRPVATSAARAANKGRRGMRRGQRDEIGVFCWAGAVGGVSVHEWALVFVREACLIWAILKSMTCYIEGPRCYDLSYDLCDPHRRAGAHMDMHGPTACSMAQKAP